LPFLIEIEVSRPSVTLSKRQQLKAFKGVTLHRDISNPARKIEVSRPSVMLQQTVTPHRDTSIPLGGSEESRQVCSSLVHPLALNLETTTLALEGRHVTASTARSAAVAAEARTQGARPVGNNLDDMGPMA
jgi:hypothetical protein